jgi:hypothetical protein
MLEFAADERVQPSPGRGRGVDRFLDEGWQRRIGYLAGKRPVRVVSPGRSVDDLPGQVVERRIIGCKIVRAVIREEDLPKVRIGDPSTAERRRRRESGS